MPYSPTLTTESARATAKAALVHTLPTASNAAFSCTVIDPGARCVGNWHYGHRAWTGTIALTRAETTTTETITYGLVGKTATRTPKRKIDRTGKLSVPIPLGATRNRPIPLGSSGVLGSWRLTVLDVTPDATTQVLAQDQFEPPPAGSQDFIADVQATYTGPGSAQFEGFEMDAVGASNVAASRDDCGVFAGEFPSFTDVFTGGTVAGGLCWQVSSSDASSLVMYKHDDAGPFFALTP